MGHARRSTLGCMGVCGNSFDWGYGVSIETGTDEIALENLQASKSNLRKDDVGMNADPKREAFIEYAKDKGYDTFFLESDAPKSMGTGLFANNLTQKLWLCWQAALSQTQQGDARERALYILSFMRPGVRRGAWEGFLDSTGAWSKGDGAEFMHVSPKEIMRIAAIPHQDRQREMEWQPIESAPRDGTFILCAHESGHVNILQFGQLKEFDRGWRANCREIVSWSPTHWMPLPPPPHLLRKDGE